MMQWPRDVVSSARRPRNRILWCRPTAGLLIEKPATSPRRRRLLRWRILYRYTVWVGSQLRRRLRRRRCERRNFISNAAIVVAKLRRNLVLRLAAPLGCVSGTERRRVVPRVLRWVPQPGHEREVLRRRNKSYRLWFWPLMNWTFLCPHWRWCFVSRILGAGSARQRSGLPFGD